MVAARRVSARCTPGRLRSVRIDAVTERRMTRSTDVAPPIDEVVATAFADLSGKRARRRPPSDIQDADRQSARAPRRIGTHARQRLRGVAGRRSQSLSGLGRWGDIPSIERRLVASRRRVASPVIHRLDGHNQTCGAAPELPFTRSPRSPQQAASSTSSDCSTRRGLAAAARRPAFLSRLVDAHVASVAAGDGSPPTIRRADTGSRLGWRSDPSAVAPTEVRRSKRSAQPAGLMRSAAELRWPSHPPEQLRFKVGVSSAPDAC